MSVKKNKLSFIAYAYAIGAIFVVLGHSTPTSISDMPMWIDAVRTFIYDFHMPLFFFVAGFLLKYTSQKREKKYGEFIKDKCIRFLTPYLVLTFVGLIPKVLMSNFVNDNVSLSFEYLFTTIFSPRDNVWGHFWFLPTLLIIYVFSYLLLKASKNKIIFSLILVLALAMATFPPDINFFALNDICDQFIFFCMGILVENVLIEKRDKVLNPFVALICLALAISSFVLLRKYSYFNLFFLLNLSNVIVGILMLYVVLYVSVFFERKGSKILDYFDGKTFSIYIISWPCQAVTEIVLNRVLNLHWYIVMLGMFVIGLFVPLLINAIYKKFKHHPKFINLLFGFNL